jgi:hypothetical protein
MANTYQSYFRKGQAAPEFLRTATGPVAQSLQEKGDRCEALFERSLKLSRPSNRTTFPESLSDRDPSASLLIFLFKLQQNCNS